jgi:dihydroceramidase
VNLRPSIQTDPTRQVERSENAEQIRQNERDAKIVRTMWVMIAYGLSVFLGGFMIWNLDNRYCSTLRRWRRQVGLPWGILLEGHGWWSVVL